MHVEAVMFDMDGTLVDSKSAIVGSYHEASAQVLADRDPIPDHEMEQILKLRGAEAFPRITGGDPELTARFADAFMAAYQRTQASAPGYPGLVDALERLSSMGVKLGIATSKARARLDIDLERLGIGDFFGFTVSGDEVSEGKPAAEPVLAVAAGLGVPVEQGLYVGDGENDVIAAQAAGMRAVGIAHGFHPEDCRAAGPEHWVENYDELVELVESLRAGAPAR